MKTSYEMEKWIKSQPHNTEEFKKGKKDALNKKGCLSANGSYLGGYEVGLMQLKEKVK